MTILKPGRRSAAWVPGSGRPRIELASLDGVSGGSLARIVAETLGPGATVNAVADRSGVQPNQVAAVGQAGQAGQGRAPAGCGGWPPHTLAPGRPPQPRSPSGKPAPVRTAGRHGSFGLLLDIAPSWHCRGSSCGVTTSPEASPPLSFSVVAKLYPPAGVRRGGADQPHGRSLGRRGRPRGKALTRAFPSARFRRDRLQTEVLPFADRGERLVVVHWTSPWLDAVTPFRDNGHAMASRSSISPDLGSVQLVGKIRESGPTIPVCMGSAPRHSRRCCRFCARRLADIGLLAFGLRPECHIRRLSPAARADLPAIEGS